MVVGLYVGVHERLHVVGGYPAEDDEAERIAHEVDEAALLEEARILAEDGALLRPLYVAFEGDQAFLAADLEDFVHELEEVEVRAPCSWKSL